MKPIFIEAVSVLLQEVSESSGELKKELESSAGVKFRRVNHFTLLALGTIFRLPNVRKSEPHCGLYLATSNGSVRDTLKMLGEMYRDTLLPMPFTFMGTSSSMGGFHIAQTLGLSGINLSVSSPNDPFVQALNFACTDIENHKTDSALVGCVDEGVFPLEEFKAVTQNSEPQMYEGGCWLKLSLRSETPMAVIYDRQSFLTWDALQHYLEKECGEESLLMVQSHPSGYVGSSIGLDFIEALQSPRDGVIALVSRLGVNSFSLVLTRRLG